VLFRDSRFENVAQMPTSKLGHGCPSLLTDENAQVKWGSFLPPPDLGITWTFGPRYSGGRIRRGLDFGSHLEQSFRTMSVIVLNPRQVAQVAGETGVCTKTVRKWSLGGRCHAATDTVLSRAVVVLGLSPDNSRPVPSRENSHETAEISQ